MDPISFDSIFSESGRTVLQEPFEGDIGEIGALSVTSDGSLILVDPLRARVLRYGWHGQREAAFGSYGEGPGEFVRISGVLEISTKQIAVFDSRAARVTLLSTSLLVDTSLGVSPRPLGAGVMLNDGVAVNTPIPAPATGPRRPAFLSRGSAVTRFAREWVPEWSVPVPTPGSIAEFPYWSSYAATPIAASTDRLFVGYSLRYPVMVYNGAGELLDSLSTPPPSFREAPVLRPGELSGPNGDTRLREWMEEFDVISALVVFEDSLLAVVHGRLRPSAAGVLQEHSRLDVYNVRSLSKVAVDVAIPPGMRILTGRDGLYVLAASPPQPWTIARMRMRPIPDGRPPKEVR